ncbi:hypothetical protein Poli38472_002747 [Pythium oligandrum]|uniref:Uncharacterized protein n=1 Tax=Pythium oligandrum TaxID=41045 RepID=A0A8K1CJD6_PYTOL|nr:hypothetical protein Poli38472_002747 [Pythium oligandrum]|eukprot:TMW63806.1 hypothetical protein Poli38472_002747 [Pythium oligandrum]
MRGAALRIAAATRNSSTRAVDHHVRHIANANVRLPSASVASKTLRHVRGMTALRCFSTQVDLVAGREALKKAERYIEEDDLANAMKYLNIAAHHDVADAQYLLGSLLEKDDEEDEPEDEQELVADAETNRQLVNDPDEPQDLKTIRKRARKHYKEYLLSKRANGEDVPVTGRLSRSIVQRATTQELDRAFGVTLQQLLDPASTLRPLSAVVDEEVTEAEALGGDSTQSIEWLRRAAANGHRDAHVYLGNLCMEQEPPLVNHALEWYFNVTPPKVEKDPHPDALFNIGMILYEGAEHANPPFPANRAAAIPYFVSAAEAGDTSAQYFMGQLLLGGDDELEIASDPKSGLMLIERAAENDHGGALFYLAQLYRLGDEECGIKADRHQFLNYLDLAMEAGDEDALYCMADIYYHGSDGFDKDLEQARLFYLAAAEAGSAEAFCCLGAIYYNGIGVKKDYQKAFLYYQEAAERDSMEAWKNLADMHYTGRGVPKNEATAQSILKMLQKMEQEEEEE